MSWGAQDRVQIPTAAFRGVAQVSAGSYHSLALVASTGAVVAWGRNLDGESTVPSGAASGCTAVAAGGYHSLALKNGQVRTLFCAFLHRQLLAALGMRRKLALSAWALCVLAVRRSLPGAASLRARPRCRPPPRRPTRWWPLPPASTTAWRCSARAR